MKEPLTKRQREIFDFLSQHIQERGYAPSLEEIGKVFGLSSLATVWKHLESLREKGYILRTWGRSRQITIAPAPDCCQACGRPLSLSA